MYQELFSLRLRVLMINEILHLIIMCLLMLIVLAT